MSIASEINRLQTAKQNIKTSLESKGAVIADNAKLDEFPTIIDNLPSGGGGDDEALKQLIERSGTELVIPNGVTKIGDYVFSYATFTSYQIPRSVTSIGSSAFSNSAVSSFTYPDWINTIPSNCFLNCLSLETFNHSDLVYIGNWAFNSCSKGETVDNVKYFGDIATYIYTKKASHTVREGTKYISGGFSHNNSTLTSIVLPEGLELIGGSAFYYNSKLTTINIPSTLKYINDRAFYRCTALNDLVLPEGLLEIGESVFEQCQALKEIIIPNSVTSIGSTAFYQCSELKYVKIGSGITELPYGIFSTCKYIEYIEIADSIRSIGNFAFENCSYLGVINFGNTRTTIPTLASQYAFNGTNLGNKKIVVPDALYDDWKLATNWNSTTIKPYIIKYSDAISQGIITE